MTGAVPPANGNGAGSAAEAGPPSGPVGDSVEGLLLQSLRRCWLLAVSLGLLTAALGAAAVWFLL